jgi:MOSC domain-containing protein YiiM
VRSAIWKTPVEGPVAFGGVNVDGDDQADRRVHGGRDKAVYAYAIEDYEWWASSTGPLAPGTFGENLTTSGIDLRACSIGDRWHVGTAILEVSQPRQPCFKLGIRMSDDGFPDRFADAGRPGTYLRIMDAGHVAPGDVIDMEAADQPAIRIGALAEKELAPDLLRQIVADLRVPDSWKRAARRALAAE